MIRLPAPAKINWFLEITGKRRDGYHTLSTVFQTISLADVVTFRPHDRLVLTCSDPSLPTDERNLAMRAAVRLRDALKETRGARMHLIKNVPMGAGLGGGSSDAATVLEGLCRLWKRRVSSRIRHRLAVSLGADVPFFLRGGRCYAGGIGDQLRPLRKGPTQWLLLIYPGFGVATKEAYQKVRLPFAWPMRYASEPYPFFNRFEDLVFPAHPKLSELKRQLIEAGADAALMSGSGSSIFAVLRSAEQGRELLKIFRRIYRNSWLVHTG